MTITDEGRLIRGEVLNLRPDKRRRYPDELRVRILEWVARATTAGWTEADCGKALGIKTYRFQLWRREQRVAVTKQESVALVRVETESVVSTPSITLITPTSYRVEGLMFEQLVRLLRELA